MKIYTTIPAKWDEARFVQAWNNISEACVGGNLFHTTRLAALEWDIQNGVTSPTKLVTIDLEVQE